MSANRTFTVVFSQIWTAEDVERGECSEKAECSGYSDPTLHQLIEEIEYWGYTASQSHLMQCRDLSRVWLIRSDHCCHSGRVCEVSMHLDKDATPRQRRIWEGALRHLAKRGKL